MQQRLQAGGEPRGGEAARWPNGPRHPPIQADPPDDAALLHRQALARPRGVRACCARYSTSWSLVDQLTHRVDDDIRTNATAEIARTEFARSDEDAHQASAHRTTDV